MLFLWATFPRLEWALQVIKAWGFDYKTCAFNWTKLNKKNNKPAFGTGYYTRSNAEVCLLATRGKPIVESHAISSVVITPIEEHSKKPDVVPELIVELCGNIPRIELFARRQRDGWDCWGNEVSPLQTRLVDTNGDVMQKRSLVMRAAFQRSSMRSTA